MGIWRSSFENSSLVANRGQDISGIWVEFDWAMITRLNPRMAEPFQRMLDEDGAGPPMRDGTSIRFKGLCLVETHLKSPPSRTSARPAGGFGHLDFWPSRITIQRLDACELVTP